MITGKEPIYPILKNRQEWEDRNDGDSLGLGHYTVGGLELKQHMVIEFVKAIYANPAMILPTIEERYTTVREAILLTKEVIKQLNEETI